jgi:hypothetical protein
MTDLTTLSESINAACNGLTRRYVTEAAIRTNQCATEGSLPPAIQTVRVR